MSRPEDHDVILANGAAAETFVDYVDRQGLRQLRPTTPPCMARSASSTEMPLAPHRHRPTGARLRSRPGSARARSPDRPPFRRDEGRPAGRLHRLRFSFAPTTRSEPASGSGRPRRRRAQQGPARGRLAPDAAVGSVFHDLRRRPRLVGRGSIIGRGAAGCPGGCAPSSGARSRREAPRP